ncbi:MAG: bifunctional 4-hydroxy-2-oxoglutarate aldolase/2-dehydro-3-deoxy-phosphogluconate aldolase [Brevinemataceae bacterium]
MFESYLSVPIIPVAVVKNEEEIVRIAECAEEFLPALELTMRTEFSYKALEILAEKFPNLPRSAATIVTIEQVDKVLERGTNIIISPGFQESLLKYAKEKSYHYIPGVATPAELEQCMVYGYRHFKFFPASVCGGVSWLKAMYPVYSHMDVKFMPLGGITLDNVKEYLSVPNVFACGGSWLCSREILEQKNWKELRKRFEEAYHLLKELK